MDQLEDSMSIKVSDNLCNLTIHIYLQTVTGIMQWLDDQIKVKSDNLSDKISKQSEDADESAPDFIEAYLSEMKTNSDLNGNILDD